MIQVEEGKGEDTGPSHFTKLPPKSEQLKHRKVDEKGRDVRGERGERWRELKAKKMRKYNERNTTSMMTAKKPH